MAMRLYTRDELEAELREKWKLQPTETFTATTQIWRTPKGQAISVPVFPNGTAYPDYLLDVIVNALNEFGENPTKR